MSVGVVGGYGPDFQLMKPIIRKLQDDKCLRCGRSLSALEKKSGKLIALHHIDFTGGTKYENNSEENLIYLCRNCHNAVHVRYFINGHEIVYGTHDDKMYQQKVCYALKNPDKIYTHKILPRKKQQTAYNWEIDEL